MCRGGGVICDRIMCRAEPKHHKLYTNQTALHSCESFKPELSRCRICLWFKRAWDARGLELCCRYLHIGSQLRKLLSANDLSLTENCIVIQVSLRSFVSATWQRWRHILRKPKRDFMPACRKVRWMRRLFNQFAGWCSFCSFW